MICDFKACGGVLLVATGLNDESERISCSRYDASNDTRHAIKSPLGNICTSFCFVKRFHELLICYQNYPAAETKLYAEL